MSIILGIIWNNEIVFSSDTLCTDKNGNELEFQKIYGLELLDSTILLNFGGKLSFLQAVYKELIEKSKDVESSDFIALFQNIAKKYYDPSKGKVGITIIGGFFNNVPKLYIFKGQNDFQPQETTEKGLIAFGPPSSVENVENWEEEYYSELNKINNLYKGDLQKSFKALQKWFSDKDYDRTCNYKQHFVVLDSKNNIKESRY